MAINVRREFARAGFQAGSGVFAPSPLPSGDLDVARAVGGATLKKFDRALTAIDIETRAIAQQGDVITQTGQQIAQAGGNLRRRVNELEQKRQDARDLRATHSARTEFLQGTESLFQDAAKAVGPDGDGLADNYAERLRKRRDEVIDSLPDTVSENGRLELGAQIDRLIAGNYLNAQRQEYEISARYARASLDNDLAQIGDAAVATDPGPGQAQFLFTGIDEIRDRELQQDITDVEAEQKIRAFRQSVLSGTAKRLAAERPIEGLRMLQEGRLDHLIANDAERAGVLADLQRASQTAIARGLKELDGLAEDHFASIRATGRGVPGLRNKVASLGGEALKLFDAEAAKAQTYHSTIEAVRWAPPGIVREVLAEQAPRAGTEGFADQQKLFSEAVKAVQDRSKALATDPAAYAAAHPAVKTREQNIALQQALGVDDYAYFTDAEAAQAVAAYNAAEDDAKIAMLNSWLQDAGKHRKAAQQDLFNAKLPPAASLLMLHAGDETMLPVLRDTLAAERQGRKALEAALMDKDVETIKQSVHGALTDFRTTLFAGAGDAAPFSQTVEDTVTLLAESYAAKGMDASTAAETAANRLLNDHFTFTETYRVPKPDYDPRVVAATGDRMVRELDNVMPNLDAMGFGAPGQFVMRDGDLIDTQTGNLAMQPTQAGVPLHIAYRAWLDGVKDTASWVNTPDGEGLMLVDDEGVPLIRGDGSFVGFRFEDAVLTPEDEAAMGRRATEIQQQGRFLGGLVQ